MRVLIACEFSGTVRRAFRALGHDAWSCDILPAEDGSEFHFQRNVLTLLKGLPAQFYDSSSLGLVKSTDGGPWDLMIAHPPCTHLAVSGARWFKEKALEQLTALDFVRRLLDAPIAHIALENPVSIISSRIRKPDQIIQPWQFGHGETKATCLWLKNLPKLTPTKIVEGREGKVWKMPPSPDRWKLRSKTYDGIAQAMAAQWGSEEIANAA